METNKSTSPVLELKKCTINLHNILVLTSSLPVLIHRGLDRIHMFKNGNEDCELVFMAMRPTKDDNVIEIDAIWQDSTTDKQGFCIFYFFVECKKAVVTTIWDLV